MGQNIKRLLIICIEKNTSEEARQTACNLNLTIKEHICSYVAIDAGWMGGFVYAHAYIHASRDEWMNDEVKEVKCEEFESYVYYSCNFFMSLKLFENKKLFKNLSQWVWGSDFHPPMKMEIFNNIENTKKCIHLDDPKMLPTGDRNELFYIDWFNVPLWPVGRCKKAVFSLTEWKTS